MSSCQVGIETNNLLPCLHMLVLMGFILNMYVFDIVVLGLFDVWTTLIVFLVCLLCCRIPPLCIPQGIVYFLPCNGDQRLDKTFILNSTSTFNMNLKDHIAHSDLNEPKY